jgi:REP-associated tyrosine transposase
MPSYRGPRVRINPETFAVTILTHQRHRILQRTTTAKLMIDTLFRYRDQSRFALHAFVVMPDHLHALLTPSSDQTIERCVQLIKGGFSFAIRNDFKGDLWQDRYHAHRLADASDYQNQFRYIANNPTRKNYPDYPRVHTAYENRLDTIPAHLKIEP